MALRALLSSFKKILVNRGVVLMYHRIANAATDPWELAVSPENFEEHLKTIKAYNVISVSDLADIIANNKRMPANIIAVTFDDGYRDNYFAAKPLLEKYNIPASFFITTNLVGRQKEFWWDALERICLQSPNLPGKLIFAQEHKIPTDILNAYNNNTLKPLALYLELCNIVRNMRAAQQQEFIESLEVWANNANQRPEYFTMSKDELLDLQSNPLFTIGAHTMTHPFLPYFSEDYQKDEIQGSVDFLQELTGNAIKYLAYPHGGHNKNTFKILSDAGIEIAFTTNAQRFEANIYQYSIPRFQVNNWDAKTFKFHLNNWMKK